MNQSEFETWLDEHAAAFSSVKNHFDRLTNEARRAAAQAWFGVLGGLDLEVARKATQAVFTCKDRPRFVDDHPSSVLAAAKKICSEKKHAAQYAGGKRTYECHECLDTGTITLQWTDPNTIPPRWRGMNPRMPARADAPCPFCERGRSLYDRINRTNFFMDRDHYQQYVERYRLTNKSGDLQPELDPSWKNRRDFDTADAEAPAVPF